MPMGPYKDFDECVSKNKNKVKDPKAYCGEIRARTELKKARSPQRKERKRHAKG